jgi:Transposase DDE domain
MHGSDSLENRDVIQDFRFQFAEGRAMPYGDIRVVHRAEWLIERIAATGSVVLRKLGETRAGEVAIHRFLSSHYVSVEPIVESLAARTAEQCAGRHVLLVQDTTEITVTGRDKKRRGFGPAANGESIGFFIHPVIAIDVETEAMIGLVDAAIWTRFGRKASRRRSRSAQDKESARWLAGCQSAASLLHSAAKLTMVADRESDIYSLFARRPAGLDLIVRAAQDRNLAERGKLFEVLGSAPRLSTTPVKVAPRGPGDKGRIATVELRAGRVCIARPDNGLVEGLPKAVELTLVEAREVGAPSNVKEPLHWRLLTSHEVTDPTQAEHIVQLYRLRWRIEQTFRALKSDGLGLEDSQIISPERMFNLAALALGGAIRTIQLVDARDGSPRPSTDVIDDEFAVPLKLLSTKLEGKTERQKNPHPPGSLAFVAWIAARLGGWNCYYKPPGPKTMRDGWNQLAARLEGYLLATQAGHP